MSSHFPTFVAAIMVLTAGASFAARRPPGPLQDSGGALSGVVTDAVSQTPLANAVVSVSGTRGNAVRLATVTDGRGRFVVFGLPTPAAYFVSAARVGYFRNHYGGGEAGAAGVAVVLSAQQWFRRADIPLTKVGGIGGRILDEQGEPAVGVFVRALRKTSLGDLERFLSGPMAKTNDRGEYRITGLTEGTYVVVVPSVQPAVPAEMTEAEIEGRTPRELAALEEGERARGRVRLRRNGGLLDFGSVSWVLGGYPIPPPSLERLEVYPCTFYPETSQLADAVQIDLQPGDHRSNVNITLRPVPAFRVTGRVEAAGAQTSGTLLRLIPVARRTLGIGLETATTIVGVDGLFTFVGVPTGTYELVAQPVLSELTWMPEADGLLVDLPSIPGFAATGSGGPVSVGPANAGQWSLSAIRRPGTSPQGYVRETVTVGSSDVLDLRIQFRRAPTIRGHVVHETGESVGGLPLVVFADPADGTPTNGVHLASLTTHGSRAEFEIDAVVPGTYALRFLGLRGVTVRSIQQGGDDVSRRPIDTTQGDALDVIVTLTSRLISLSGTLRDRDGLPAPGATVILFPQDKQLWNADGLAPSWTRVSQSATDGSFQFSGLRAGEYYLIGVDRQERRAWQNSDFLRRAAIVASRLSLAWGENQRRDAVITSIR